MIQAAIFDFDGVIADSLDFTLEVANSYLKRWGKEPLEKEPFRCCDVEELFRSNRTNIIEEFLLFWRLRSAFHKNLDRIPVHQHIVPVLKDISGKAPLSLLTSNSKTNVLEFLKAHQIHNYFVEIRTDFLMFNKDRGLRSIVARKNLSPQKTVYIGDEPRDIRAAQKVGIIPVVVDWGYSERTLLKSFSPAAIASSTGELLEIINSL